METSLAATAGWLFVTFASAAHATPPLTDTIGSVPPDIFHAMSGNYSAARGYTGDLTLWAKPEDRARLNAKGVTSKPATALPSTIPGINSRLNEPRAQRDRVQQQQESFLQKMSLLSAPDLIRTVPSSSR